MPPASRALDDGRPPLHIGIVACSGPGAACCYETLTTEGAQALGRRYAHPELSLHCHPFDLYMGHIEAGRWEAGGELMLSSAHKLASLGAELLVCPDNTIHQGLDLVRERSPLPWVHIAEVVAATAKARGFQRVALLGTRFLMEGPVYPRAFRQHGLEWRIPTPDERGLINERIFTELVHGVFTKDTRREFLGIIGHLQDQGCDAVGMCCTEIPLLLQQDQCELPLLDSTRLLARAALRRAAQR